MAKNKWTLSEKVELFHERVQELRQSQLVKSKFNATFVFEFDIRKKEGRSSCEGASEETIVSFSAIFRQFILRTEPIFYDYIYAICWTFSLSEDFSETLDTCYGNWHQLHEKHGFSFISNGTEITPFHMADHWLHGMYFHNDKEKRKKIQQMSHEARHLAKMHFLRYLMVATEQIILLDNNISVAQKQDDLQIRNL